MDANELARTFVDLTDTLVDDFDVPDLLYTLATGCVKLLDDVAATGLVFADRDDRLQVAASSTGAAKFLELFQLEAHEGPCVECYRSGEQVVVEHLEGARVRWPRFVPAAMAQGYVSVSAVPMRLRGEIVGALNLFGDKQTSAVARDLPIAQAMADVATIVILQHRLTSERVSSPTSCSRRYRAEWLSSRPRACSVRGCAGVPTTCSSSCVPEPGQPAAGSSRSPTRSSEVTGPESPPTRLDRRGDARAGGLFGNSAAGTERDWKDSVSGGYGVLKWVKRSDSVSAPASARAGASHRDQWMRESAMQQMFRDVLDRGEVKVAVTEVSLACPGSENRPVHAWAAVTDRALHARLTLGAGVHQTLRIDHDQVKRIEASGPDQMSLLVAYWNPRRAVDEAWHMHLESSLASAGFAAALSHAVSKHRAQADLAAATATAAPPTATAAAEGSQGSEASVA